MTRAYMLSYFANVGTITLNHISKTQGFISVFQVMDNL